MTNSTGQITSSGTAADNGASSTYAELTDTNNTDGTSSQTQIQSSGPIAQSQTNYAGANETGGITSTSDWLANTAAGVSDNTGISNATVYVPTLVLGNIGGGNDTIQLSGLDTLGLQGSNDFVTDTVGGVTVRIGNSLSESFSGVIGDQLTLSGGDTVSATGGGLIANLSGTANAFTGYGDTANILAAWARRRDGARVAAEARAERERAEQAARMLAETPGVLLARFRAAGLHLTVSTEGHLMLPPGADESRAWPGDIGAVVQHKAAIVALLRAEASPEAMRRIA